MKSYEALLLGIATTLILAASYVILDTINNLPPDRERICRSESGHKHVPCGDNTL